jgi:PAS domain S-box-containing protein
MNIAEFQLRAVGDPRLAVHATSPFPAWLWSIDGTRVLWANPVGAWVFGAANPASLATKDFGPADSHRRQVAQLAGRLPPTGAIRLERLRGFGASLGTLITCGCAQFEFADGCQGILIVAAEPVGRAMPLVQRLQRLVEGVDTPLAAFARDGVLVGASDAARSLPGFHTLSGAALEEARDDALKQGRSETSVGSGHMVLQRVGSGADIGLIASIAPLANEADQIRHSASLSPIDTSIAAVPQNVAAPGDLPVPDYERPAMSGEAPAEFTLIDEFAETPEQPAIDPVIGDPLSDQENVEQAVSPSGAVAPAIETHGEASAFVAETAATTEGGSSRRHPLRLLWQMDAEGRFWLGPDEFSRLIGASTAAGFGRPWNDIAGAMGLDPDGLVARAIATRAAWSGITVNWPADGGAGLPIELSGSPIFDSAQNFLGYRGLGICSDLEALARLEALRRHEFSNEPPSPSLFSSPISSDTAAAVADAPAAGADSAPAGLERSRRTGLDPAVETQDEAPDQGLKNVVPFRPISDGRTPVLTPVENSAFNELARQLSARLEGENGTPIATNQAGVGPPAAPQSSEKAAEPPSWLTRPEPAPLGESARDRMLLDLLPDGVLIYRLDRLLYANRTFLQRIGYPSLHALEQAGGLDALYVEPGVSSTSSTSDTGTPVTISAPQDSAGKSAAAAIDARLHAISWDEEPAHALIFAGSAAERVIVAASHAPSAASEPSAVGHANAEELGAILDATADGIVMFDAEGNISSCNRSAEALFGFDGADLVQRDLGSLFAPESQGAVLDYLASLKSTGVASPLEHGREVLGRVRGGGLIPLSMTMGRTQAHGPNFFAVLRDLSQAKKSESELRDARRLADRAANAKADLLARISHEIRIPLNAIIGFAEVMISERFGALGNDRYVEYMKDIRASGERVVAIIDDLTDLSRIETGTLDLSFTSQNLNDLIESCVAVLQPQANRERIIIRTSLAHVLPPVVADARALRQITLNLIGNSIHLANAGGQVIVSTALNDFGDVVLRVRDTGQGLNDDEVAAAMEPFRTQGPSDQAPDASGVSLSLTKALVEANRAQFHIRTGARSGTLVEVVFSPAVAGT